MRFACKQTFSLGLFLFLLTAKVSSQPKCKVEYYSTEQGLSHQRVTAMLKDREGFMWFGSWDGINRFDGHIFTSYKSSPGDKFQLGNGRIDHMTEDQAGHLWIQAYDGQIYRFDKKDKQFLPLSTIINPDGKQKTVFSNILAASGGWLWLQSVNEGIFCVSQTDLSQEHFLRYRKEATEDYRLPSDKINFFHEDREHRIWIGTPDGLCCLERSATGIYKNNKLVSPGIATGINLTAFDEDADHLYFSTTTGNLITFEKGPKTFFVRKIASGRLNAILRSKKNDVLYATASLGEVIIINLKTQKFTITRYHPAETLYSLYEDQTGSLWIEPEKRGAIRFDPLHHSFQFFSLNTGESLNYIGNRFRVLEDDNGTAWVNMKEGGFGYYDPAKKSIAYILNTPDAANYRLPEIVYTIYYDKAGILWLTTNERELIKIVLQGDNFKQQLLVTSASSKSDNEVRGIFYDKKGRLWVGAKRGNLYIYQNDVPITNLFVNEPPEGLGGIYSILQDSRGNIWLGTKGNGLYKASPVNKEETKYHLEHFVMNTGDSNGLPCNEIYTLLEDRQGRIWIGSFDNGLALVVNEPKTKFIHIGEGLKQYPGGPLHKIRHMALDGEGNIWIGTTNGLLVLDANNQHSPVYQYKMYGKVPGDKESLGNNDIQFIHQDSKNRMWLATSGGGFCRAIGKKPFQSLQFKNYTTRDGLPNDYILSCAEDKQKNLWIATENGLSKFNPETGIFRNYDSYDGLPKIAFSEASACRELPSGNFAFGTRHGYLFFDPEHLRSKPIPANIALTNLQINNEDAGPGANETVLKTDINYVSGLTLRYNQNIISIDYAILDHRTGNRQACAYRLLGFDTIWHDDRQQRTSTYTNLPPGHYVFEVKSGSSDLYLNQPYRRLAITILPPPWKTGWAYLLYAVLMGVLLFFIRRYALAMIRLRNKMAVEQKLAALKLNFFTNISHELRTPLTLIINPLEQVARKGKLSPEIASYIDVARKNATRMVRFINQLLDLRKVQSEKATLHISRVEMVSFVKKIAEHFTEAANSKRIKLDISSDGKELIAWIDAEKLDVVIYNLLGNAIKFTPEGKLIRIFIETIPGEKSFSIAVYDQGPGVPREKLEEIFELFHEGGPPPGGTELKGTGIGLALSREFVNLLGGRVWAENNGDGGLTVKLKLKLGTEHYNQASVSFVDLPKAVPLYEKPVREGSLSRPVYPELPEGQEAPLVLLVEDNDDLRTFIRGQLSEYYRVEVAANGEEGLQKAINLMPDLIVSDIMMPKMDGIEMLDKIKNDTSTSHIPVVLLSAKYSIESQIAGLKYGADYYITKPFNNEFLVASVDNLLRQRKRLFEILVGREKPVALSPGPVVITSRDELFLKEVVRVVEDKMADADFNMEAVAGTMAMSYSNFYKKFKSLTGSVPIEFVREMRLQRARQLLEAGGNNVSEVAYIVGFSNPKYFSTCFKEKYRVSPSDYLKTNTTQKTKDNLEG